jgi:hypothetical protein
MPPLTSHHLLPPFPDDIKTAPLVSVPFKDLENNDSNASATLFKACKELGFFYLDLFGSELGEKIIKEAEKLNTLQQEFFELPNEVKDIYGRPHLHPFYAYRYSELDVKDKDGVPLRSENYNVSIPMWHLLTGRLASPHIVAKARLITLTCPFHGPYLFSITQPSGAVPC